MGLIGFSGEIYTLLSWFLNLLGLLVQGQSPISGKGKGRNWGLSWNGQR